MRTQTEILIPSAIRTVLTDFSQLVKLKLNLYVVVSAVYGYLMATSSSIQLLPLFLISLGGFLIVGAGNGLNQVIEKEYDKFMTRTENRPVASGRMSVATALYISIMMGIGGVFILGLYFNKPTGFLALVSLIIYAFIYTPLKRIHPVNVFVGAIPGAMPPVLGYISISGKIDMMCLVLFLIQFFWQFVHFWSIAWILDEDYKKAGFKMLPFGGRSQTTALQISYYALALIPVVLMPYFTGLSTVWPAIISLATVIFVFIKTMSLYKTLQNKEARQVMYASYIFLTLTQFSFLIDKFYL